MAPYILTPDSRQFRPAEDHWFRLGRSSHAEVTVYQMAVVLMRHMLPVSMSAAWHGGLTGADEFVGSISLLDAISRGMDWWFSNDFAEYDCLYNGGKGNCPCGTPGMWNTNWFSNVSVY